MLERLMKRIADWCGRTGRTQYITGTTPDDIYLIRYLALNHKLLKVYIHIFLRSDLDDPHDHPWNFSTLMIRGTYFEDSFEYDSFGRQTNKTTLSRTPVHNQFVRRKSTDIHRIRLRRSYQLKHKDAAPMTLFFAGGWKRDWGFWKQKYKERFGEAPREFIPWRKYLGVPDSVKARS